jgi:D-sedoheptulose 7-phosphate isomerase
LAEATRVLSVLQQDPQALGLISQTIVALRECLARGGKILACGNGGSLCDAAHFAEELTGRFRRDRRPLAAIAINDPGHITCTANDYGYDEVFARAVEGLGRSGDALIALSTSGNSPSIVKAIVAAKKQGMWTCALLGRGGGACRELSEVAIVVPGETSDRIQELHMLILHIIVEGIEAK